MEQPRRFIHATAPIRMCDLGGWTDTWFAEQGMVLNIGVYPYVEVHIEILATPPGQHRIITIHAENYGDRYALRGWPIEYDKHPLLEASLDAMHLPEELSLNVNLFSRAPAGCSTGTSASASVALLAALDLLTPGRLQPLEIARLAHHVESEKLGLQCGIQDQLAAAFGGISFIEMDQYPKASLTQLHLEDDLWWELERRMLLVYMGQSHISSDVHKEVIGRLEQPGSDKSDLERLRKAAKKGRDDLLRGDILAFGQTMIENTEGQAALHPSLVSDSAKEVIELAKRNHCIGWKVNGAGGDGGSLSLLFGGNNEDKHIFTRELEALNPAFQVIPTHFSRLGIRRWETSA